MDHEAIEELLGAYALNAVEPHEAAMIDAHIDQCPHCRAELEQHLDVAALLPATSGFAPSSIWDTISDEIDKGTTPATPSPVVPLRRRWIRPMAAAAAFVLIAGTAIVQSIRVADINDDLAAERATVESLSEQLARPVLENALSQALENPAAQRVMLGSQVGGSNAIIVLMPDGTGYLAAHTLKPLPPNRTYQLWAIVDGKVISAGILGSEPGVVPFHIDPEGFEGFAITDEVVGGVESSENSPVVAWLAA